MHRAARTFITTLLVSMLGLSCATTSPDRLTASAPSGTAHLDELRVRRAIERSLPWLEEHGRDWLEGDVPIQGGNGCVSCHHVGFAMWSHNEAARAGLDVGLDRIGELERDALEFVTRPEKAHVNPSATLILGRTAQRVDPHAARRRLLIGQLDTNEGWWRTSGQFRTQKRTKEESDEVMAMWTIFALASLDRSGESVSRSLEEGVAAIPESGGERTTEWSAVRLLVEHALARPGAGVMGLRLLESQNADGGWGWVRDAPSNAMTTGQLLYTLARIGDRRDREAIERGRRYLVATQAEDGTWHTSSELTSAEPSEGKDYIYRFWGTAWAAIGLARSLHEGNDFGSGARGFVQDSAGTDALRWNAWYSVDSAVYP